MFSWHYLAKYINTGTRLCGVLELRMRNTCEMFLDCPHWLKIIIKNNLTIAFNNHTEKSFQMTRKDKEMSPYFSYGKEKSNGGGPTSMGSPVSFFSKVPVFSIPYNPWPAYSNLTANYSLLSKKFQLGCAFFIYFWSFQRTAHIPSL